MFQPRDNRYKLEKIFKDHVKVVQTRNLIHIDGTAHEIDLNNNYFSRNTAVDGLVQLHLPGQRKKPVTFYGNQMYDCLSFVGPILLKIRIKTGVKYSDTVVTAS